MPSIRKTHSTQSHRPVLLLALGAAASADRTLASEIESLLADLGLPVTRVVRQKRPHPESPYAVGEGKLTEIRKILDELRQDSALPPLVVVTSELLAGKQRALAKTLDVEVIDRAQVILRVFQERARTRLAQLEIEKAELEIELPRVRDDQSLGDREGGGGRAARGHTNVELRKELYKKRIAELDRRIEKERARFLLTKKRRGDASQVALIGYTNAGKSSWMRALTRTPAHASDKLFATLSTTVRLLSSSVEPILVADTVGFMEDLPVPLFASFRSTLEEALEAQLVLHVVDASNPHFRRHLEVTRKVLEQVGAQEIPERLVLSKADLLSAKDKDTLRAEFPGALLLSAFEEDDAHELRSEIRAYFEDRRADAARASRLPSNTAAARALAAR